MKPIFPWTYKTAADYKDYSQAGSWSWNNVHRDYSVSGIDYDANGNMLHMTQRGKGVNGTPVTIDSLFYEYDNGNKLLSVTDLGLESTPTIHDFDNSQASTSTYTYDGSGNLASDALKDLSLFYNHLNLPTEINKGTSGEITKIYTASGTLVQKTVVESGNVNVEQYWGPFVYKDDVLSHIYHPEGRVRWIEDSALFRFDYFVKDHLGNVRTVITADEGAINHDYLATHEIASAHIEEVFFDHLNEVRSTKPLGSPYDFECALLNGSDPETRIGTALVLQVMAGDKIKMSGYSYHEGKGEEDVFTQPEYMLSSILSSLTGSGYNIGQGEMDDNSEIIGSLFSSENYMNAYEDIKGGMTNPDDPRAFLNYLVFDGEMNLVPEQSGAVQVHGNASSWEFFELPSDLTVGQNGYIAIYISNEQSMDVWFDDLLVTHLHGRLLEEQHYYPHGLLIGKITAPTFGVG